MNKKQIKSLFVSFMLLFSLVLSSFLVGAFAKNEDIIGGDSLLGITLRDNYKNMELPNSFYKDKKVNSVQPGSAFALNNMFDHNKNTKWEAVWGSSNEVVFDFTLSSSQIITGFTYLTRSDNNIDGTPSYFDFYTSTDGVSFSPLEKINTESRLGEHVYMFSKPVLTKFIKIKTNARAITEFAHIFIPSSDENINTLTSDCENYINQASDAQGLQSGAYRPTDVTRFRDELTAISQLKVSDDNSRVEKASRLYSLATSIKRALLVACDILNEDIAQARLLLNSAVISDSEPLKWSQQSKDALESVYNMAMSLIDNGDNPLGDVYDTSLLLKKAIKTFINSANKPTIKTSYNGSLPLNYLMDGLTETRIKVPVNKAGNVSFEFDYINQAQFINMSISSWWADEQAVKAFSIEYFDDQSQSYKMVDGGDNGKFVLSWSSHTPSSTTKKVTFTPFKSNKVKFTILPGYSYADNFICFDEIAFGIDVDPKDIQVNLSPSSFSLGEGESLKLNCVVLPFYASNKNVIFSSSNNDIASVDSNGVVRAKSVESGKESSTVEISATTEIGNKTAKAMLTVTKGALKPEQRQEVETRWAIANKFAQKSKPSDFFDGVYDAHLAKLSELKQEVDSLSSVGGAQLIKEKLDNENKILALNSNVTINAVKSLIDRIAGANSADKFIIELISDDNGQDVFEVDYNDQLHKPIIRGNNGVSLATAFNYYLKYFCYQNFPVTGPYDISLPSSLPVVSEKFRNVFPYEYRHYFNENCEYKYTTNNYDENEWRRRLDWLAMNGFNMYLFDFDDRPVWLAAADAGEFGEGFDKSARDEIIKSTGGNFYPDFGNYIVSEDSLKRDTAIGNKVMTWGYELGLEPEIRPFYGALPFMFPNNRDDYYKNRSAQFKINLPNTIFDGAFAYLAAEWMQMPQGIALSYFVGDDSLSDEVKQQMKDLYIRLNDMYYKYFQKVFAFDELGRTPKYFIKDLVQEQGFVIKNNAYPQKMLTVVDNSVAKIHPDRLFIMSSWRVQAWQFNYIDKEHTLVIDLRAETNPRYNSTGEFWGTNWLWSMLYNFGGNTGFNSSFRDIANVPYNCHQKYSKMKGIAIAPEGADTDPATYELMAENCWRNSPVNVNDWLNQYYMRRYGKDNYQKAQLELESVSKGMLESAYSKFTYQGPIQTLVTAFPYIKNAKARTWGSNDLIYDPKKVVSVWENMIYASQKMDTVNDAFKYDLIDYSRQVLGDLSKPVYNKIASSYTAQNKEDSLKYAQMMIDICLDMDSMLATCDDFSVGKRLEGARNRGATTQDKDYFEKFDRAFLTIWVYGDPGKSQSNGLLDYCNRHLAGLMTDYYARRWQVLKNKIEDAFSLPNLPNIDAFGRKYNGAMKQEIYKFSNEWVDTPNTTNNYSPVGVGDSVKVSGEILEKYKPLFTQFYGMSFAVKKDNLQSYYNTYSALEKDDRFDEQKWTDLQSALTDAKNVIDNEQATQLQVNSALSTLKDAYNALIEGMDIVDKTTLIAEYNVKVLVEKGNYTQYTYDAFLKALTEAKAIIDNEQVSQDDVDTALENLLTAFGNLKEEEIIIVTVDKSPLINLIQAFSVLDKNDYSSQSFLAFETALNSANAVIANDDATNYDVNDAFDALFDAYTSLVPAQPVAKKGCNNALSGGNIAVFILCLVSLGIFIKKKYRV